MIYFDNAATTKQLEDVTDAMRNFSNEYFANPSSIHNFGFAVEKKIAEARSIIAKSISAKAENIIFTSGATEANNIAVNSIPIPKLKGGEQRKILYYEGDHPSLVLPLMRLVTFWGEAFTSVNSQMTMVSIPMKNGAPDISFIEENLDSETSALAICSINNTVGTIFDIEKVNEIVAKKRGEKKLGDFLFIVDATQHYKKIPLSMLNEIDYLITSAHKIGGAKGTGFLYAKNPQKVKPLFLGGGQENGKRAGTENTAGIIGFAKAAECIDEKKSFLHVKELTRYLIEKIEALCSSVRDGEQDRARSEMRNGEQDGRTTPKIKIIKGEHSPYINTIVFEKYPAEVLVHILEEKNIFVSSGSACSSKSKKIPAALMDLGLSEKAAASAIRVSFSRENTTEEIDEFISVLGGLI